MSSADTEPKSGKPAKDHSVEEIVANDPADQSLTEKGESEKAEAAEGPTRVADTTSVREQVPGKDDREEDDNVSTSNNDANWVETHHGASEPTSSADGSTSAPPLPEESIPPLPSEAPPDDGWEPRWEETQQAWYFYNRFTGNSQWDNPRVPAASNPENIKLSGPPGVASYATAAATTSQQPPELPRRPAGGYDPTIHGDYDPTAWYAQQPEQTEPQNPTAASIAADPGAQYEAIGAFNRFTGRYQNTDILNPENFNDENKSRRQMNAFFDVDAAANSHDGRSLKAERSGKKVSKSELKQFKEKRKAKKEEKRRAWLRD